MSYAYTDLHHINECELLSADIQASHESEPPMFPQSSL